jgi:plasmid stability protein
MSQLATTMTLRNVPEDLVAYLREVAAKNRRSLNSQAVIALDEFRVRELTGVTPRHDPAERLRRSAELRAELARMPTLDTRTDDEILGYDEYGLST